MTDLNFRVTPMPQLLCELLESGSYPSLGFLSAEGVVHPLPLQSVLSKQENSAASSFLYSLGKSDAVSQKRLISAFREEMQAAGEAYVQRCQRDTRLYITFCLFIPAVLVLIMI